MTHKTFLKLGLLGALYVLLVSLSNSLIDSAYRSTWFEVTSDEGYHSAIIGTLAKYGEYRLGNGAWYSPQYTTGPTLIVPSAILSQVFNIPAIQSGRYVSFTYHLLTLFSLVFFFYHQTKKNRLFWGLFGAGLFHWAWRGWKETPYFQFGILGDGVAVFYLLGAIFLLNFRRYFLSGLFLSLTFFSKPYYVFIILATALIGTLLIISQLVHLIKNKYSLKSITQFALGGIAPWLLVILVQTTNIGWGDTLLFWKNYPDIMNSVNGAKAHLSIQWEDFFKYIELFLNHHERYRTLYVTLFGLLIMMSSTLFIFIKRFNQILLFEKPILNSTLLVLFLVHSFWWLFISKATQSRYFLPALTIAWFVTVQFIVKHFSQHIEELWPKELAQRRTLLKVTLGLLFVMVILLTSRKPGEVALKDCIFCRQAMLAQSVQFVDRVLPIQKIWHTALNDRQDMEIVGYLQLPRTSLPDIMSPQRAIDANVRKDHAIIVGPLHDPDVREKLKQWHCIQLYPTYEYEGVWFCNE